MLSKRTLEARLNTGLSALVLAMLPLGTFAEGGAADDDDAGGAVGWFDEESSRTSCCAFWLATCCLSEWMKSSFDETRPVSFRETIRVARFVFRSYSVGSIVIIICHQSPADDGGWEEPAITRT